jgi:hypothetical protein
LAEGSVLTLKGMMKMWFSLNCENRAPKNPYLWWSECTFNISSYNIIISHYKCTFGYETECPHNLEGIPLDSKKQMFRHIYGRVYIYIFWKILSKLFTPL